MQFIIRADQPYQGHVQSVLEPDGTVAWSGGLTPDQYASDRGIKIRIIDEAELASLTAAYTAGLVTSPQPETAADFQRALDVLPPSRWTVHRGVEMFHICERVTHDIVAWHARLGDRCYTFNDRSGISNEDVTVKVAAARDHGI
jgi:hypothetical protein